MSNHRESNKIYCNHRIILYYLLNTSLWIPVERTQDYFLSIYF